MKEFCEYSSKEEDNTRQYTEEEHDVGQSKQSHSLNETETEENQDKLQEEQDNDNKVTKTNDDDEEDDTAGQFEDHTRRVLCSMQHKAGISSGQMLLDSQSTMDIFCNTKMLTNISDAKNPLGAL